MTPLSSVSHWLLLTSTIVITLAIFVKLGLYRAVIRYITAKILLVVAIGMLISVVVADYCCILHESLSSKNNPVYLLLFWSIVRCGLTPCNENVGQSRFKIGNPRNYIRGWSVWTPVTILRFSQMDEYYPVAFGDDNRSLQGQVIHGVSVFSPEKLAWLIEKYEAKKILWQCQVPAVPKK
ncbi:hypothetical protein O5478_18320 [Escherichia coli]|nr:hypothetical protein [Escherichia coli]